MNRARLLAIGKLLLLLGIPSGLVLSLFGAGVHCGVTHRGAITGFERDVLGLDVEVPKAPESKVPESKVPEAKVPEAKVPEAKVVTPEAKAPEASAKTQPKPPEAKPPEAKPPEPAPPAVTTTDPLAGDLAARLAMPVRVRVKVTVDDELIAAHPDWIDYVQRTVAAASQVYEQQFGITLELAGVTRWSVVTAGLSADQLLSELKTHGRDGCDVMVGMTARPLDGSISGEAETPLPASAFNGAYGIVYAVPGAREPHLRTLLHEVGHMFGALDITDSGDPAWQAASWMSYAPVRDGQVPWIDAANRRRVLERKDKPFAPEPGPAVTPVAAPDTNPTL
jgi:hypothetical protein